MVAAAIHRFEAFNRYRNFNTFRREQAISFKEHLATRTKRPASPQQGDPLLDAKALAAFFEWLSASRATARRWCT